MTALATLSFAENAAAQDGDKLVRLDSLKDVVSVKLNADGTALLTMADGTQITVAANLVEVVNGVAMVSEAALADLGLATGGGISAGILLGGVAALGGIVAGVSGGGDSGGDAAPVNTPPSFTSGTSASIAEGQTAAYTATATDAQSNTITYSLSGADVALFDINASTGAVTFKSAPDFENPADSGRNNIYDIVVTANDGTGSINQNVAITVTNRNDNAPVFTSSANVTAAENNTATSYDGTASDADGDAISFSITGGADAALFDIDTATGVLSFKAAPDFEAGQTSFTIDVSASDGANSSVQTVTVTLADVNDNAPVFASGSSASVAENQTSAYATAASDADAGTALTYSLSGTDAALFNIDAATGAVTFKAAPDFEAPADANGDNVYDIVVAASDGANSTTRAVAVTVTNLNDNSPVFTSGPSVTVNENLVATGYVAAATDADGNAVSFAIGGGADAALFAIDATTGALSFVAAPDFEAGQASFTVDIAASDGTNSTTRTVVVTLANVNDNAPVFTSGAAASVAENQTAAYTASATDADAGTTLTYSLSGTDAALFDIDAATGAVTFKAAPDFETPADANGDNVYDVVVTASDGTNSTDQAVAITITNLNDVAPVITSGGAVTVAENLLATGYVASATDAEGDAVTFAIGGGADAALFAIDAATGALSFLAAPDFEAGQTSFTVDVAASDGVNTTTQTVVVTLANVNDNSPVFTSGATASVAENGTSAYTAVATDADTGTTLTYSLSGADAALFDIDAATGAVTFKAAPDFEAPADANGDNVYDIIVSANDGTNSTDQAVAITVTDVSGAPAIISAASASVAENGTAAYQAEAYDDEGDTVIFSMSGTDAALFAIDAATGAVTFIAPPDFEAPADANGDNVYDIIVSASDGTNSSDLAVAITVNNINDNAPVFNFSTSGTIDENTTAVFQAAASDADGDTITYGLSGADSALFDIDAATGVVTFKAAPDFETPADADGDNLYLFNVTASDGTNVTTLASGVEVLNVNDVAPVFVSGSVVTVDENSLATGYTAAATDVEGDAVSYAIDGGADAALFAIDATSGALSFLTAPDFEAGQTSFTVDVAASDGVNSTTKTVVVTLANVNDNAAVFTSGTSFTVQENQNETGYVASAVDADGDAITYLLISGDTFVFDLDQTTGELKFAITPNFEDPLGNNGNSYTVTVRAFDGVHSTDQVVTIDVTDVNDPPYFNDDGVAFDAAEGQTFAFSATAEDEDGITVDYILSGADAALFNVDEFGDIYFNLPPDFEAPADANGDNIYEVTIEASDGSASSTKSVMIAVTNINDIAPVFTSGTAVTVDENLLATGYVAAATDAEGDTVSYSISGGADAALFAIDAATGALSFLAAPDFEAGQTSFTVDVAASDGINTTTQTVVVTLANVNDNAPVFNFGNFTEIDENTTAVFQAAASDADGDTITYGLSGGDSALFDIDAATGVVTFKAAPDAENPADGDGDNIYLFDLTASDGTNVTTLASGVEVRNVNDVAPVFVSGPTNSVEENQTGAYNAQADDDGSSPPFYSISGADADLFNIDGFSGQIFFKVAPDFENPADANGDNVYDIIVTADDGLFTVDQAVAITVTNLNETPVFTSGGAVTVDENLLATGYVASATDAEGDTITFAIGGGADAALFAIDATTGALSFLAAPDFEAGQTSFTVDVAASDGVNTTTKTVVVTLTNVNDNAPVFTSGAAASLAENRTEAYASAATDADGDTLTYSLSGTDAALFDIDAAIGAVTFKAAPDFEAPADANGDNVYDVIVSANDGTNNSDQAVAITVSNLNDNSPVFTSGAAVTVDENLLATGYIAAATDADGNTLTYLLSGTDAALFDIDPATGAVTFKAAPDFEAPVDANGDNVYDVVVTASDGSRSTDQQVLITVANVVEGPVFTSGTSASVPENGTAAYTATASGTGAISYSLSGSDAALFAIDAATGEVTFIAAPDFESPQDSGNNSVYDIVVTATDNIGSADQAVAITVTNIDDNDPIYLSPPFANVDENAVGSIFTALATDADGDPITYGLIGTDAALFNINSVTGEVSFKVSPDFENPADADSDNKYDLEVTISDGTGTQIFGKSVFVFDVNEAPVFISGGGVTVDENILATGYIAAATDPEGAAVSYAIGGGADAALFDIDAASGALSFKTAPDFEAPADANGDNVYDILVTASDGTNNSDQAVAITVTNLNDVAPVITSGGAVTVAENLLATGYVASATDAEGDAVTFAIGGGADGALFAIDAATGALSFLAAPDFEAGQTSFTVDVAASDGVNTTTQTVVVTLANVNDNSPVFTSGAAASLAENGTAAYASAAADADGDTLTYSLSGADAALFDIDAATGALSFIAPPDFEAPADAGGDNVYDVVVTASDGVNSTDQAVAITVTNLNDNAPVFRFNQPTATLNENIKLAFVNLTADDGDGDPITYSLSGPDAGLFKIIPLTGTEVRFLTNNVAFDFEAPIDTNGDNVYDLIITASDGINSTDRALSVTINNLNDNAPVFTSGTSVTSDENLISTGYTATATDADGNIVTFSIGGADAALFTIDAATGALSFVAAPDFEAPADAGGDNVYDVVVTASDGGNTTDQAVAITVTNLNDNAPVFTSSITASVPENSTAAYVASATDADGNAIVYLLSGTDEALFDINVTTGVVTFKTAPDFENPADANGDNVYDIVVSALDGNSSANQPVAITVTDVDPEAPVFTSPATADAAENQLAAYVATATGTGTITYQLSGIDAALFAIDSATGEVTFLGNPDFEAPQDDGNNNVYDIVVTATDAIGSADQAVAITVTNVNEAPVFANAAVSSNAPSGGVNTNYIARATDADGTPLSYTITGGPDTGLFTIDAVTGVVRFLSPADFAAPQDAGADNIYNFTVSASDGTLAATQDVAISVIDGGQFQALGAVRLSGSSANDQAGSSVSLIGDLDGDGTQEVLIGARNFNGGKGAAYVVFGGSLLALTGTNADLEALVASGDAVRIDGRNVGDQFGRTVAGIGDIDGDGLGEVVIGAPHTKVNFGQGFIVSNVGEAAVVYSSAIIAAKGGSGVVNTGALDKTQSVTIAGWQINTGNFPDGNNGNFGIAISDFGDFDGDGKADFVITQPGWDKLPPPNSNTELSQIRIILGSEIANDSDGLLQLGTEYSGPVINGVRNQARSGSSVTTVDDYNGDGFADVVVGSQNHSLAGVPGAFGLAGSVTFFSGNAFINDPLNPAVEGSIGFSAQFTGTSTQAHLGYAMTTVADLDGDGKSDLVTSEPFADIGGTDAGDIRIFFSSDFSGYSGVGSTNAQNLARLNDATATITGSAPGENIGKVVGDAGDVDGDGKGDFFFTVEGVDGKIVLVLGSAVAALKGQQVTWQSLVDNGQAVVFEHIDTTSDNRTVLSNVGDLDGDGFDDFVIGAPASDPASGTNAGGVYIISGALIVDEIQNGDGVIDLTTLVP